MLLVQEIYYMTTGNYKYRKNVFLVYDPNVAGVQLMPIAAKSQAPTGNNFRLLSSLEVTPRQFREIEKYLSWHNIPVT